MKSASMAKHVYFVRHGESEENVSRVVLGPDAALTEQGVVQAARVAERVEGLMVDALIASSFVRAQETAAAIAARTGLAVETTDLFAERRYPSMLTGKHEDDPMNREALAAMYTGPDVHERYADEETFAEFMNRAREALRFLEQHPAERLCVVTHAIFTRALANVVAFDGALSKDLFLYTRRHMPVTNTGITYMQHDQNAHGWQLITWNDQAHLG